jgi:hypothetical protein
MHQSKKVLAFEPCILSVSLHKKQYWDFSRWIWKVEDIARKKINCSGEFFSGAWKNYIKAFELLRIAHFTLR